MAEAPELTEVQTTASVRLRTCDGGGGHAIDYGADVFTVVRAVLHEASGSGAELGRSELTNETADYCADHLPAEHADAARALLERRRSQAAAAAQAARDMRAAQAPEAPA